jgi:hypothetical protein
MACGRLTQARLWKTASAAILPPENLCEIRAPLAVARIFQSLLW